MLKIIIASGPVIIENREVLLNQHGDTEFWKFCGGKIKAGETLMRTAERRAKEELGINIEIIEKNPFLLYTQKVTIAGLTDVILVHYLAKRIGEITPGADIREWKWISLSELKKENLAPNIIPTLKYFNFL